MLERLQSWLDLQVHILTHYDDVIMSAMASQITSLTIVYSIVYSGADQRKHQSSASLAFVPHKWPVTRKMFPFDESSCIYDYGYIDTLILTCYGFIIYIYIDISIYMYLNRYEQIFILTPVFFTNQSAFETIMDIDTHVDVSMSHTFKKKKKIPLLIVWKVFWLGFQVRPLKAMFMGSIWGRQDPGGPHVSPMNFAIWDATIGPHN